MRSRHRPATLRPLRDGEIVLDRRLPGHLRDERGRIVARKGWKLTDQRLRSLRDKQRGSVYGGRDWPPLRTVADLAEPVSTPEELLRALQRRRPPPPGTGRVRRHRRHVWRSRLTVTLQHECDGLLVRRDLPVTTQDISVGGFSFICEQHVYEGTVIYARFKKLPGRPLVKAVARNCEYLTGRRHRVGAEFVPFEPEETAPVD